MTQHFLVDRCHPLPSTYMPPDLVEAPIPFITSINDIERKNLISSILYEALLNLYKSSLKKELSIVGISGFRSYDRQKQIYESSICKRGFEYTDKYIAAPGTSEHQTGLAIDLSTYGCNYELIEEFAFTKEGIWLRDNAESFGFTFSYPKDSYEKTGYYYEPWHIRFTCKDAKYYV